MLTYPFPHRNPCKDRQALEAWIRAAGVLVEYSCGSIPAPDAEDDDLFHDDLASRTIWIADFDGFRDDSEDIEHGLTACLVQAFENLVHCYLDAAGTTGPQGTLPVVAVAGPVIAEARGQRIAGEHVDPGAVGRSVTLAVGQLLLAASHHQAEQEEAAAYGPEYQRFVARPFELHPVPAAALLKWTAVA